MLHVIKIPISGYFFFLSPNVHCLSIFKTGLISLLVGATSFLKDKLSVHKKMNVLGLFSKFNHNKLSNGLEIDFYLCNFTNQTKTYLL